MAAAVETLQYERDLRSARKEWKRIKDSSAKWTCGRRPLAGIRMTVYGEPASAAYTDAQLSKFRPEKKQSDLCHPKNKKNPPKARRSWDVPDARVRSKLHARSEILDAAAVTADDDAPALPLASLWPSTTATTATLTTTTTTTSATATATTATETTAATETDETGTVYYSFDHAESPGHRPLTLGAFVKTTGRETEKLVEREYEVLDCNGEALRGRKARRVLRKEESSSSTTSTAAAAIRSSGAGGHERKDDGEGFEDEGFELV